MINSMALELPSETFYSPSSSVLNFPAGDYYDLSADSGKSQTSMEDGEDLIHQAQAGLESPPLLSLDADYSEKVEMSNGEVDVSLSADESAQPSTHSEEQQLTSEAATAVSVDQPLNSIILLPVPQAPVVNCGGLQLTPQDIQKIQQQLQQRLLGQPMTVTAPVNVNLSPQQYVIVGTVTPSNQQFTVPQNCNSANSVSAATVTQPSTTPTLQPILQAHMSKCDLGENLNTTTSKLVKGHVVRPAVSRISEDLSHLEELQNFAKHFKQRRVELGYTQGDVGAALGTRFPNDFSQTTISRFEASNLSAQNMRKLMPLLQAWLQDQENRSKLVSDTFASRAPPSPDLLTDSKRRKKRTTIEESIRDALEKSFLSNPKPNAKDLSKIANEHNIERDVVRVWFCNRRQREKKLASKCPPMQQIPVHSNCLYNPVQIISANSQSEPKSYVYAIGAPATKLSATSNEEKKASQDENDKAAFSAALASPQGATLKGYVKPIIFNSS